MERTARTPTPKHPVVDHGAGATIRAGVLGASGTAGTELVALLEQHPRARVDYAASRQAAGRSLRVIDPGAPECPLCHPDEVDPGAIDVAFLCLPHGASAAAAARFAGAGVRTIDLSGDLRLHDQRLHEEVYGSPRPEELAGRAVYGLTEYAREALPGALVVSNPGCYPTCAALALLPLAEADRLDGVAVVDAKSGVSGAGRPPTATNHFLSVSGDVRPYKVGRRHRHVPELEQTLREHHPRGVDPQVVFNPHLVPLERGIEETIVLTGGGLGADEARELLRERYAGEPFVEVLPEGEEARIRGVAGTNRVQVGVHDVEASPAIVLTAAIDNLIKGAAGQAVQNMNAMLGLPEALGLPGALGVEPASAREGTGANG